MNLEELIAAFEDGDISDDGYNELLEIIQNDEEARTYFLRYMESAGIIKEQLSEEQNADELARRCIALSKADRASQKQQTLDSIQRKRQRRSKAPKKKTSYQALWIAVAASILVFMGLFLVGNDSNGQNTDQRIVQDSIGSWEITSGLFTLNNNTLDKKADCRDNDNLRGNGTIVLTLNDKSTFTLSGNIHLDIHALSDTSMLELAHGNVAARVSKQNNNHVVGVITKHLQVKVIGTAFDVIADNDHSEVVVSEGNVSVKDFISGKESLLSAGEKIAVQKRKPNDKDFLAQVHLFGSVKPIINNQQALIDLKTDEWSNWHGAALYSQEKFKLGDKAITLSGKVKIEQTDSSCIASMFIASSLPQKHDEEGQSENFQRIALMDVNKHVATRLNGGGQVSSWRDNDGLVFDRWFQVEMSVSKQRFSVRLDGQEVHTEELKLPSTEVYVGVRGSTQRNKGSVKVLWKELRLELP